MSQKSLPYREGDWFAVPLQDGRYAAGLVARSASYGKVVFGYFFRLNTIGLPSLQDLQRLTAQDSSFRALFGDLELYKGGWPLIGHADPWDRAAWPMTPFVRLDDGAPDRAYKRFYSEDEPARMIREVNCSSDEAKSFPRDGVWGSGAIERHLTRMFSGS
jgi:hypothetical protein